MASGLTGGDTSEANVGAHFEWLCHELHSVTLRSFYSLPFVVTSGIQGIEQHDMVFATTNGASLVVNPWVLGTGREIVDTAAWNSLIRGRIGRPLNGTIDVTTLGCVLTLVAAGELEGDPCWSPPAVNISSDGDILTITGTRENRYPEYQFRARLDGTLADIPRFPPRP